MGPLRGTSYKVREAKAQITSTSISKKSPKQCTMVFVQIIYMTIHLHSERCSQYGESNHQWVNPPEPPRSPLRPCQQWQKGWPGIKKDLFIRCLWNFTVWRETGCQHCEEVIQTMSLHWYIPSLPWAYQHIDISFRTIKFSFSGTLKFQVILELVAQNTLPSTSRVEVTWRDKSHQSRFVMWITPHQHGNLKISQIPFFPCS